MDIPTPPTNIPDLLVQMSGTDRATIDTMVDQARAKDPKNADRAELTVASGLATGAALAAVALIPAVMNDDDDDGDDVDLINMLAAVATANALVSIAINTLPRETR